MDLSTIADLTDDQKTGLLALIQAGTDETAVTHKAAIAAAIKVETEGLKSKNTELLAEKKAVQEKSATAQKEREEAEMAGKDKAIKDAKDFESLQAAMADKDKLLAERDVSLAEAVEKEADLIKGFAIERDSATLIQTVKDLSSKFVVRGNPAADMYMSKTYMDGLEVRDGGVFPKDKAITYDQFVKNINDAKENASYIVGTGGSGSGATGNQGNGGAGTNAFDKLSPADRLVEIRKQNP